MSKTGEPSVNSFMEFIKRSELQNIIRLDNNNKDVATWYDQFKGWKEFHNVEDPKELFTSCKYRVIGIGNQAIAKLPYLDESRNTVYPSLEEMRDALFLAYNISNDPEDIIDELKRLSIKNNESVADFNCRYRQIYNKLEESYANRITKTDYMNCIKSRTEAWRGVYVAPKKITINEAFEIAERFDAAEQEIKSRGSVSNSARNHNHFASNRNFNNNNNNNSNNNSNNNHNNNSTNNSNGKLNFKGNGNHKVQFCYFCKKPGHRKFACPEYNEFEREQYLAMKSKQKVDNPEHETNNEENPLNLQ